MMDGRERDEGWHGGGMGERRWACVQFQLGFGNGVKRCVNLLWTRGEGMDMKHEIPMGEGLGDRTRRKEDITYFIKISVHIIYSLRSGAMQK